MAIGGRAAGSPAVLTRPTAAAGEQIITKWTNKSLPTTEPGSDWPKSQPSNAAAAAHPPQQQQPQFATPNSAATRWTIWTRVDPQKASSCSAVIRQPPGLNSVRRQVSTTRLPTHQPFVRCWDWFYISATFFSLWPKGACSHSQPSIVNHLFYVWSSINILGLLESR